jgi:hypothetical protein
LLSYLFDSSGNAKAEVNLSCLIKKFGKSEKGNDSSEPITNFSANLLVLSALPTPDPIPNSPY